jgi:hypothetical protein
MVKGTLHKALRRDQTQQYTSQPDTFVVEIKGLISILKKVTVVPTNKHREA